MGSYRLLQQIGEGGMGRVFVAEHVRLGRKVALKVLRSEFSGNPEAVKRFFDEARAVNCINHENIIEVSDFVENPRGSSFYIMELLSGLDLCELEAREGVLDLARGLRIAIQVCGALGAAHRVGIIHRDLKPDNIFLIERAGRGEFVKLLDFGVAKLMNTTVDEAATFRSSAGMVVGTPDYMAPEQAMGHAVDHLVDVYSMGVILFEMVAGRRPFVGKTARDVMVQHLTVAPTRPSQLNPASPIPEALEELILSCLAKDPGDRPPTMQAVEDRLTGILDAQRALRADGARRASPRRRRPLIWVVAGIALLAGAASLLAAAEPFGAPRDGGPLARARISAPPTSPPPRSKFTIEAVAPGAAGSPIPASTETDPHRGATERPVPTPSPAAEPARPQPAARRRPFKLDRDAVLNPFE